MRKKIIILFTILITLFTIGVVPKQFQNDTFFNISIGKYILENGIDMQEHFSWISGLTYTYSHWAFDILTYIIYAFTGFTGIYISVIVIAIIMNVTLFILLTKRTNNPLIALTLTLLSAYLAKGFFTARSQIISFVCFIIEIYCIEKFIETNKKKYAIILIILSIIIANFHAATWPLYLVLFLPYLASAFMNVISAENIYSFCKNRAEKKLKELPNDSPKYSKYLEDVNDYSKLIERSQKKNITRL